MRAAIKKHAGPNGFRPLRRGHLTIELLVVGAAVLTAFASYYRDTLTHRELSFRSQDSGSAYVSYQFDDRDMGGTSHAAADPASGLGWTCDLTTAYAYRYCGFGVLFDPAGAGGGVDLSGFDRVKINLRHEGPGRSLRLVLKNKDPRYSALGASTEEKVNQLSVPVSSGVQTVEVRLEQLGVAEWWRDGASRPSAELAEPEFYNVVSMELLTASDAEPGRHQLSVETISFRGSAVSAEVWYGSLALAWLLLIGSILLQRRREAARWSNRLLESMRTTVDTIPHMVWSLDSSGKAYFNRRWEDFTGVPIRATGRLSVHRLIHPEDVRAAVGEWKRGIRSRSEFDIELRIRSDANSYRWMLAHAVPSRDESGAIAGWYGTCTDVHDRVLAQQALRSSIRKERRRSQQLKWTSEHDALTRLPNRRAFETRLESLTLRSPGTACDVGLLLIDMDYFKHLNDTLGHGAGDELLRTIAARLKQSVRREDFVARIGGDEFAVILPSLQAEADLASVGNKVAAAIQLPLNIGGHVVRPGTSIGGAICPNDGSDSGDFLKRADAALYALKRSGRGGFRLFEKYMLDEVKTAASQLTRAREAIADNSITAFYQPKVAIRSGAVAGFEALLRYTAFGGALERPDTLAEAFNDYELAAKIGEQMQRQVARDVRAWINAGLPFGRVSINAAPAEFLRDDYAERLLRVLDLHGVPPACIEVEVTEHAFVERGREYVARALDMIKSAGVTISLDDFGTGHSSLSHMRDFPVDLIKIDRSYIEQIAKDEEIAALVAGVIHLACSLGLEVVAEGVETSQQFELLRSMGCHFAQGYLLGYPVLSTGVRGCISSNSQIKSAASEFRAGIAA
jgi:diguanylate cyclase (GGDEF)-like protein/PAS domain S-box-containing protein